MSASGRGADGAECGRSDAVNVASGDTTNAVDGDRDSASSARADGERRAGAVTDAIRNTGVVGESGGAEVRESSTRCGEGAFNWIEARGVKTREVSVRDVGPNERVGKTNSASSILGNTWVSIALRGTADGEVDVSIGDVAFDELLAIAADA